MNESVCFIVAGTPVPKQSFRKTRNGGYTDPRMSAWQERVSARAREAMQGREPITGPVAVRMVFVLANNRRVDLDNLAKGTGDGLRKIVFVDDCQVVHLDLIKHVKPQAEPGVLIEVRPGGLLPGIGGLE